MSDALTWVQWWAFPWRSAHSDWGDFTQDALFRSHHASACRRLDITPCLPVPPSSTVLQLALMSTPALDRALALVDHISHNAARSPLPENEKLWCRRLYKALPPTALTFDDDAPLQLLRLWVEPATWQRLRLRFPQPRVFELEKNAHTFKDSRARLDTLWQAVVWRIKAMPFGSASADSDRLDTSDVMPPEN